MEYKRDTVRREINIAIFEYFKLVALNFLKLNIVEFYIPEDLHQIFQTQLECS